MRCRNQSPRCTILWLWMLRNFIPSSTPRVLLVLQTPDCNCLASHFLSQKSDGGSVKTGSHVSLMMSRQTVFKT
ncbi:hypothetical protein DFH29DRAFT_938167 [Suillus ampliporus]|nr:hypothetical protein DFH29DRAFT_938167 [Suillus ampliporus]